MKADWILLREEDAQDTWNINLAHFDDCSPFQSYEWGQYQKALGWQPLHYLYPSENNGTRAMCLGLLRRFPLQSGFLWCTGGPVGDIAVWNDLAHTIRTTQKLKHLYFRFRCDRRRRASDVLLLKRSGLIPPSAAMGSDLSMEFDLTPEPASLRANLSSNWQRMLRQTQKRGLTVTQCISPDIDDIRRIFAEMEGLKKLPELFSREKLRQIFQCLNPALVCFCCYDKDGTLVAVRGALVIGDRACDYIAATSADGRRLKASYPLFWALVCHLRSKGITRYDLGGIDPWGNPGVYAFKKTTGASEVELLGEWDWASSPVFRWLGNWVIRNKQAIRKVKLPLQGERRSDAERPQPEASNAGDRPAVRHAAARDKAKRILETA